MFGLMCGRMILNMVRITRIPEISESYFRHCPIDDHLTYGVKKMKSQDDTEKEAKSN